MWCVSDGDSCHMARDLPAHTFCFRRVAALVWYSGNFLPLFRTRRRCSLAIHQCTQRQLFFAAQIGCVQVLKKALIIYLLPLSASSSIAQSFEETELVRGLAHAS